MAEILIALGASLIYFAGWIACSILMMWYAIDRYNLQSQADFVEHGLVCLIAGLLWPFWALGWIFGVSVYRTVR